MAASDEQDIVARVESAYASLSPRLRKAARYVQKNPSNVALYPLRQVAAGANVSPTTLVRLSADLGFASYNAFKDAFREWLRVGADRYADRARNLITEGTSDGSQQFYQATIVETSKSLTALFEGITARDVVHASEILSQADRIYVLGMRSMLSPAFTFAYLLKTFNGKVTLLENRLDMFIDELGGIGRRDAMLVFSYEPYSIATVKATDYARRAGTAIIAVTDSKLAPIAQDAAHVFVMPPTNQTYYQSLVPAMALVEMLASFILIQSGEEAIDRISAEFSRRRDFGAYWKDER